MYKALNTLLPQHYLMVLSLTCIFLCWSCAGEESSSDNQRPAKTEEPAQSSVAETEPTASETTTTATVDSAALLAAQLEEQAEREAKEKIAEEQAAAEKAAREKEKRRERRKRRPKVKFEKTTHDYGLIMQGDKVEYQFKFTNTGKTDLVIKDATATCGCTRPSYPFIPIAPGEEGYIGVVFDTKGKLGKQKPAITVVTNASPKTYKLYLDGFVDAQREEEKSEASKEGAPE